MIVGDTIVGDTIVPWFNGSSKPIAGHHHTPFRCTRRTDSSVHEADGLVGTFLHLLGLPVGSDPPASA
jgi:hypothetical protein